MAEFDKSKELLNYLDIPEDIDSADKLKEYVDTKFVSREQATKDPKIIGEINGPFVHKMKKIANENGIEFDEGELKDKVIPDIFMLAIEKQKGSFASQIEELKTNKPPDEALKKWEDKYNKQTESLKEFKSLATQRATEIEKMKAEQENFIKTQKVKAHKDSAFSSVPLSNTASKFEIKGFRSMIEETYKPDFDEDGNIFPTKDGKRIPNEKKKDTFLSYQELIKFEADKEGLSPKNGQVKHQKVTGVRTNGSGIAVPPEKARRPLAARPTA